MSRIMAENDSHERVLFFTDKATGLKGIIAVHDTTLGPALGGTRMLPYKNEREALADVLRLSKAMTYKAAAAGENLGGGKAVIIGNPHKDKSETLFKAYGRILDRFNGGGHIRPDPKTSCYITAEDIGIAVPDLEIVRQETNWVTGTSIKNGGSGDSAPATAFGVFQGMRAAIELVFGNDSLKNKVVAIQGVGKVGYALAQKLHQAGAKLIVADINYEAAKRAQREFGAEMVDSDKMHTLKKVDVFSPCARGPVLNSGNVSEVKAEIVAGAANNQLEDDHLVGELLHGANILYVPDFVLNAGGIINLADELNPEGYNESRAMQKVAKIYERVKQLLVVSRKETVPTTEVAMRIVRERLAKGR